jgi:hypothetical protein
LDMAQHVSINVFRLTKKVSTLPRGRKYACQLVRGTS